MTAHRTVILIFSGPILLIAITLGIYAITQTRQKHLPTSIFSLVLSIALPIFTLIGFFLPYSSFQTVRPSASRNNSSRSLTLSSSIRPSNFSWLPSILPSATWTNQLITILTAVLLTLSGSSMSSSSDSLRECTLSKLWGTFFQAHDADTIRAIQDAFQCCGFVGPQDRAWPFESKKNGIPKDECLRRHSGDPNRNNGCFQLWGDRYRSVEGALLGCGVALLLVQALRTYFERVGTRAYEGRASHNDSRRHESDRDGRVDEVEDGLDEDATLITRGRYLDEPPASNEGGQANSVNGGQRRQGGESGQDENELR